MHINQFDYELPEDLIAQYPQADRTASRLLKLNQGLLNHLHFWQVIDEIEEGDLLVFNETRVIPGRLYGTKATGGKVEVMLERLLASDKALVKLKASKPFKNNEIISIEQNVSIKVLERKNEFYLIENTHASVSLDFIFKTYGHMPLPPYIKRQDESLDSERYQTVFAKVNGAVAAPTAGLHFDEKLIQQLKNKGVQLGFSLLHVGAGTYQPIRHENIHEHRMHHEYYEITATLCEQIALTKQNGKKIIAVGTTSLRALESAARSGSITPIKGETDLYIYPPYNFKIVDALITNFHLPKSSLLVLVSAFAGIDAIRKAYQEAILQQYRFFSYGDAMIIFK